MTLPEAAPAATRKRRIYFLSAARSDYDLMSPVLLELRKSSAVDVGVIACSAQLSPFHGSAVRQIEEDCVPIVGRIETLYSSESWAGRSLSFASVVEGLTRFLQQDKPDILFVTGDREEHLAGAIVANFFGLHVAHLHGGDRGVASEMDELCRPAISKMSHYHFTATEKHRERLIRMGELADNVWTCGGPGLDRLLHTPDAPLATLEEKLGFRTDQPFLLVIQHSSPLFSKGKEEQEMRTLLQATLKLGIPVLCSYPNHDPGNVGIRCAIDAVRAEDPLLHVYHNLPRQEFVTVYRRCAAIVGNSSSLVLESTFLKIPAILVGPRQDERECSTNVVRIGFDSEQIEQACRRAVFDSAYRAEAAAAPSLYGDGHAAPRIAKLLATIDLDPKLLLKTMPY